MEHSLIPSASYSSLPVVDRHCSNKAVLSASPAVRPWRRLDRSNARRSLYFRICRYSPGTAANKVARNFVISSGQTVTSRGPL